MTASTNTIIIRTDDGELDEREGVFYAEEATHARTEEPGVAIQYAHEADVPDDVDHLRDKPCTEWVEKADLVGVYDDIAEEPATDEYKQHFR